MITAMRRRGDRLAGSERSIRNVLAVVAPLERDLLCRAVGRLLRLRQCGSSAGDAQHTAAGSDNVRPLPRRSSMEDHRIVRIKAIESKNGFTDVVGARIA